MSTVTIQCAAMDDWTVWLSLDDHDPVKDPFGFVIGVGQTREDAIGDAVQDLVAALTALQRLRAEAMTPVATTEEA